MRSSHHDQSAIGKPILDTLSGLNSIAQLLWRTLRCNIAPAIITDIVTCESRLALLLAHHLLLVIVVDAQTFPLRRT